MEVILNSYLQRKKPSFLYNNTYCQTDLLSFGVKNTMGVAICLIATLAVRCIVGVKKQTFCNYVCYKNLQDFVQYTLRMCYTWYILHKTIDRTTENYGQNYVHVHALHTSYLSCALYFIKSLSHITTTIG